MARWISIWISLHAIIHGLSLSVLTAAVPAANRDTPAASCRFITGDDGWPTKSEWNNLNITVNGRLIATVPLAHVCHDPSYLDAACDVLRKEWGLPGLQFVCVCVVRSVS